MPLLNRLKLLSLLILVLPTVAACNAKFTDLRPKTATDTAGTTDSTVGNDTSEIVDIGDSSQNEIISTNDTAGSKDKTSGVDGSDTGSTEDLALQDQTLPTEIMIAKGTFKGNEHYPDIRGDAMLVKKADGTVLFRVENLVMANVPGPAFVLANREKLAGGLDSGKGDLLVAPLQTPYQKSYEWVLSGGDTGQRQIVVYCIPFEVELGGGLLVDVQ